MPTRYGGFFQESAVFTQTNRRACESTKFCLPGQPNWQWPPPRYCRTFVCKSSRPPPFGGRIRFRCIHTIDALRFVLMPSVIFTRDVDRLTFPIFLLPAAAALFLKRLVSAGLPDEVLPDEVAARALVSKYAKLLTDAQRTFDTNLFVSNPCEAANWHHLPANGQRRCTLQCARGRVFLS